MFQTGLCLSLSPYKDAPPSIVAPLAKGGRASVRWRGDSSARSAWQERSKAWAEFVCENPSAGLRRSLSLSQGRPPKTRPIRRRGLPDTKKSGLMAALFGVIRL